MDEYFTQKCVTSDAIAHDAQPPRVSTWTTSHRCEFVVVQENHHGHGASRAVLASIANMDSATIAQTLEASSKLTHVDYSSDGSCFESQLLLSDPPHTAETTSSKNQLLPKLQQEIKDKLAVFAADRQRERASARPVVVLLDSLNVLLEQNPLQQVLRFLRQVRQEPLIGSVIVRFNASVEPKATRQVLVSESTAVALVETASSLNAYPILAKERRREIPKEMHGFVLLLRQKKNGRSSESVDYFQIAGNTMLFFTAAQAEKESDEGKKSKSTASTDIQHSREDPPVQQKAGAAPVASPHSSQAALPVRQEEVSFNLSISVEEQLAKSKVQLPYMHQGPTSSSSQPTSSSSAADHTNSGLFFIDEDDPDWDDDDLDDDLDI